MHHVLIIKHGALGDVVRTSYFLAALRRKHQEQDVRLSWITLPQSLPLLRFHPDVDDIWTSFEPAKGLHFDHIFSLDDEEEALAGAAALRTRRLTGAYRGRSGEALYTDDAAEWFDMGLISRFGKARADELKKANAKGHAEIFARMFGVTDVRPAFFGNPRLTGWASRQMGAARNIGINGFAGGRWPSKELGALKVRRLCELLLADDTLLAQEDSIVLLGAGPDRERNRRAVQGLPGERVLVIDTDASVLHLAAVVAALDHLVSSDSLALHLGIAQGIPFTAVFAPTSAVEIDDWGHGRKVVSTAADYCSYRGDADTASVTAERVHATMREHNEQEPRDRHGPPLERGRKAANRRE